MAKYQVTIKDDFDRFVDEIVSRTMEKSDTITFEEEASINAGNARIYVIALERYAFFGGNRASLNITFVGYDGTIQMVGTSTGGSGAIMVKINTISEEAFLKTLIQSVEEYVEEYGLEEHFSSFDNLEKIDEGF